MSVAAAPLPAFPAGAQVPLRSLYVRPGDASYLNQFFPTAVLDGYPSRLVNPYSEQWTIGVERKIATGWVLRTDYVGSHALRINRPLDVDPPSPFIRTMPGQTRTAQAANLHPSLPGFTGTRRKGWCAIPLRPLTRSRLTA